MSAHNCHIVFITPGFAKDEADSTCMPYLQVYFKALIEKGFKITVIALHYPNHGLTYSWKGTQVYSVGAPRYFKRPWLWVKTLKRLITLNRKEPITVFHSFWLGECALIGQMASKLIGQPHINTLMGQDVLPGNRYCSLLPINAMTLISLSEFHSDVFFKNYKINTPIIHFGVDPKSANYAVTKTIDFIGIGSLIPVKNYDLFVEVIAEISKEQSLSVLLIGDGPLLKPLRQKINALGLESIIHLPGNLPNEQVLDYLAKSKVLLHTSKHEGFGMVFAEALQQQTMVVSTPVGSIFGSPNVRIANNKAELIDACKGMLNQTFDASVPHPFNISTTIHLYSELYYQSCGLATCAQIKA